MSKFTTVHLAVFSLALGIGLAQTSARADDDDDRQTKESFEKEITIRVSMNYLLYLPKEYDGDKKRDWPLMLFLHGAGERGDNLDDVKKHGPPKLISQKKDFPFIVVSPQAGRRGWDPRTLNRLLDEIIAKHRVDKDRVYVTGLSMGGYGTWSLATAYPERFAAIAPICGGGNPGNAKKIKNLPAWVFHGAKDTVVPLSRSEAMVDALKEAGSTDVKLTIYPEADHDSWTESYNNPELYKWFLKQKRSAKK